MRLAILDDYQHAALGLADWDSLKPAVTAQTFHDTLVGFLSEFSIPVYADEYGPSNRGAAQLFNQRLQTALLRIAMVEGNDESGSSK